MLMEQLAASSCPTTGAIRRADPHPSRGEAGRYHPGVIVRKATVERIFPDAVPAHAVTGGLSDVRRRAIARHQPVAGDRGGGRTSSATDGQAP